ncbi:MAG: hypothetical protein HC824_09065, partial [Synechococcales cyanobacterium RM1_1_8]|nr:hypothetical protein [Synechococcales cyanobacterium RM1_1_8]
MKLTLLSKTISTLGLLAALSAVIGPSVQQAAQAQSQLLATSQSETGASNTNLTIAEIVAQSGGEYDENNQDFDILLNAVKQTDLIGTLS